MKHTTRILTLFGGRGRLAPGRPTGTCGLALAFCCLLGMTAAMPARAATVTGAVHWDQPTGISVKPGSFGNNVYEGFRPDVAGTPGNATYKNNFATMKPGIIRYHNMAMAQNSSSNVYGWVTGATTNNPGWDATKIGNALSGSYTYNPARMICIATWPDGLCVSSSDKKLQTQYYTTFANWCASLVRIVNITQGHGVKYWEVTNERDGIYWGNCAELGRIYNQAAAAMKAVDPTIKVGGPAFGSPENIANVDAFFSTAAANVDFVSYHQYFGTDLNATTQTIFNTAAGWGAITNSVRNEYAKYSTRTVEYYHDEYNINWASADPRMVNAVGVVFDALAAVAILNANATGSMYWEECGDWYGNLDRYYTLRPSAYLYQILNTDGGGSVESTSSSDNAKVVLFGTKSGSWVKLLLINRSEAAQTIQLSTTGLPTGANSGTTFTTKQVGGAASITYGSTTLGTLTSTTGYSLPANTVTMLVLDTSTIASPPAAPTGLTATAGNARVQLSWTASVGATSYNVKRSTVSGSGYATVASPTTTSYTNTGLTNGGTYYYVVSAVNASGESANSAQASARPYAVSIASGTATIDGTVESAWNAAPVYSLTKLISGTAPTASDCSSTFKAMWNSTNLFVLFQVTDNVKKNDSANVWDDDDVEVFVDGNWSHGTTYDGSDDIQWHFGYGDSVVVEGSGPAGRTTGIAFAKSDPTSTSYVIEVKIPWTTVGDAVSVGWLLGFDTHIDDDDDGGARDCSLSYSDPNNTGWQNPSVFAVARLN